jgi:hypothetical protein
VSVMSALGGPAEVRLKLDTTSDRTALRIVIR